MTGALPPTPAKAAPAGLPVTLTYDLVPGRPLRWSVPVLGDFDGFHPGHRTPLQHARDVGRGRMVAMKPHPRSLVAPGDAAFRLATPQPPPSSHSNPGTLTDPPTLCTLEPQE